MELIEGSETSANHNRTPGKYPKEYIQDSKHGESLKSRNSVRVKFMESALWSILDTPCWLEAMSRGTMNLT
jgi:hypothetical protein